MIYLRFLINNLDLKQKAKINSEFFLNRNVYLNI